MSEDMFRDLRNSREYVTSYHSKLAERDEEGRKLSAMVLQSSAWPFAVQEKTVDLPLKVCFALVLIVSTLTQFLYSAPERVRQVHEILLCKPPEQKTGLGPRAWNIYFESEVQ
jgi:hypothetical protein